MTMKELLETFERIWELRKIPVDQRTQEEVYELQDLEGIILKKVEWED